jgi:hypothetical protein
MRRSALGRAGILGAALGASVLVALVAFPVATAQPGGRRTPARDAGAPPRDAGADASAAVDAGDLDAGVADAGVADPVDADGGADGGRPAAVFATCIEHVPPGAKRPLMDELFPKRGTSGYAVELRIVIAHGKGEKVLPEGIRFQSGSDEAKAFEKAGFYMPDPTGGVAPKITVAPGDGTSAVTTVTIPVVALPPKAGRNLLELPPLPIAIARANNDYVTLCTAPHTIQIEDPTINELDPKVKPNPPGRPQREEWPLARNLAIAIPVALALAVAAALLDRWWRNRPRAKPEAPRIPPWVTALQELDRIRRSSLLEEGKRGEHFDRVSDVLRRYLGARYGFEAVVQGVGGLETTTREMIELLERVRPPIVELPRIREFLDDCDLVKFARFTPTSEHCLEALARGETIVQRTVPVMQLSSAPAATPPAAPGPPPSEASA